ncbi:hypothetical protein D3C85_896830 [compost metagenome]
MQGQPDDDRQRTGRRQHALDRQIEHIGQGGNDRDQENHRTEQILKQSPGVPDPLHHHRADQHGQGPRAEQPPADLQAGGRQMQGYVIRPGRRLHRVQAFVEQQEAEQRKNHHPHQQPPGAAKGTEQVPQPKIDQDQRHRANQRVFGEQ